MYLILLATYTSNSQNECNSTATPEFVTFVESLMGNSTGCVDPNDYNESIPITFNLILRYNTYDDGQGGFTLEERQDIVDAINAIFNPQNISFNIKWSQLRCTSCFSHYDNWPERPGQINCIQGDILQNMTAVNGSSGFSQIGSGTFRSKPDDVSHEIGHALGLFHTFRRTDPNEGISEERMTRTVGSNCDCNCLEKGDMICDTGVDPYWYTEDYNNTAGQYNLDMFTNCDIENIHGKVDDCNTLFANPTTAGVQNPMFNIMSYHYNSCGGVLTIGQNRMIRRVNDLGGGQYKFQYNPAQENLEPELFVDEPLDILNNRYFDGDLIINSNVRIQNCEIQFAPGRGIKMLPGSQLIIDNATIGDYNGEACHTSPYPGGIPWNGIEIIPNNSNLINLKIIRNSSINASDKGLYNIEDSNGLLNVDVSNSNLNSNPVNFSQIFGAIEIKESFIGPNVRLTDVLYAQFLGCDFGTTPSISSPPIIAENTILALNITDNGVRCKIAGGTAGIQFASSSGHYLAVSNTDFINCKDGILVEGTTGPVKISDCTFQLPAPDGITPFTGITLNNGVDFEIYDNHFTGSSSPRETGIVYNGLMTNIQNSNIIINNNFESLQFGVKNENGDFGGSMGGVEFKCNTFTATTFNDFAIQNSINPSQGSEDYAAGNSFSRSGQSLDRDFRYNGSTNSIYHYKKTGSQEILDFYGIKKFNEPSVLDAICTYPTPPNGPPTTDPHVGFIFNKDGNGIIKDSMTGDPDFLDSVFIACGPWVTIPNIQEALNNSTLFTQNQLASWIAASPWVITDPYVYYSVFESGSFSASSQSLIRNAFEAGDERIDYEMGHLEYTKHNEALIRAKINQLYADTTGMVNYDSLVHWIVMRPQNDKYYQAIEVRMAEGNVSKIDMAIADLSYIETRDPVAVDEQVHYEEIAIMERGYTAQGLSWKDISMADKVRLTDIATTYHGLASQKARNILAIYFDETYSPVYHPGYDDIQFRGESVARPSKSIKYEIYPNPANDQVNINIINSKETGQQVSIKRINGSTIYQTTLDDKYNTIDIGRLESGVYILEIADESGATSYTKFIKI